jgi:hypothetical protein
MRTFLRRVLAVIAIFLIPLAGGAISALATFGAQSAPGPDRPIPAATPPAFDPAKPTAVVVIGDKGLGTGELAYSTVASCWQRGAR